VGTFPISLQPLLTSSAVSCDMPLKGRLRTNDRLKAAGLRSRWEDLMRFRPLPSRGEDPIPVTQVCLSAAQLQTLVHQLEPSRRSTQLFAGLIGKKAGISRPTRPFSASLLLRGIALC
jgi:hypothetical protein